MAFQKGQSGNPGGMPGGMANRVLRAKAALDGLGLRAVERLGELIESPDEKVALGAVTQVLARIAPVPKQSLSAIAAAAAGGAAGAHLASVLAKAKARAGDDAKVIDATATPLIGVQHNQSNQ